MIHACEEVGGAGGWMVCVCCKIKSLENIGNKGGLELYLPGRVSQVEPIDRKHCSQNGHPSDLIDLNAFSTTVCSVINTCSNS